jgi:hypothetical protein
MSKTKKKKRTVEQINKEIDDLKIYQQSETYLGCKDSGTWYWNAHSSGVDNSIRKLQEERNNLT